MSIADVLYQYTTESGLFTDHRIQIGQFFGGEVETDKFLLIKPMRSDPTRLIKYPVYSVYIIGPVNSTGYDETALAESFADYVAANYKYSPIDSMTPSVGMLVFSAENRPVIEVVLDMVVSL